MASIRVSPIAGAWYPGTAPALAAAVDAHLSRAVHAVSGDLVALIAPHAGLQYSGPVAAHAYGLMRNRAFDVAVLVGPSHFVGFDGVAIYPSGGFQTPFGVTPVDEDCAAALLRASPLIHLHPAAHQREHSLEMQLPFIQRVAPSTKIVPVLMGHQTDATARALADALAATMAGRRALLVASSDLSHYHDAHTAGRMDSEVISHVMRCDPDGLQHALDACPEHACGGGPIVAVLRAAKQLGATSARILNYADSGDVSGDKSSVVGYLAAAIGRFSQ
jgi:MEMO1 family protein